jgi:hypothetical protein
LELGHSLAEAAADRTDLAVQASQLDSFLNIKHLKGSYRFSEAAQTLSTWNDSVLGVQYNTRCCPYCSIITRANARTQIEEWLREDLLWITVL